MGQFQQQLSGVTNSAVTVAKVGGSAIFGNANQATPDLSKLPSFKNAKQLSGLDEPNDEMAAASLLQYSPDTPDTVEEAKTYDAVRQFQYEAKVVQDRQYMKQLMALMVLGGNKQWA